MNVGVVRKRVLGNHRCKEEPSSSLLRKQGELLIQNRNMENLSGLCLLVARDINCRISALVGITWVDVVCVGRASERERRAMTSVTMQGMYCGGDPKSGHGTDRQGQLLRVRVVVGGGGRW